MEETTLSGQHRTTSHAEPTKLRSPFGWKGALFGVLPPSELSWSFSPSPLGQPVRNLQQSPHRPRAGQARQTHKIQIDGTQYFKR